MNTLNTATTSSPVVLWDGPSIETTVSRLLHNAQRVACRAHFTLLLAHEADVQRNADALRQARRQATALLDELHQLDSCLIAVRSVLFRALMRMDEAIAASAAYRKPVNREGNH